MLSIWIILLSLPMLMGGFLASPYGDQESSGYAYRHWAAEWWRKLGHVPLWNPDIFGGMPFLAGMSGDVLYPTAWLRLVLPTDVAMNLGFVIHYVLAGVFMYWFLRTWRVSWTGAVIGGLAYQLSGIVASYVSPGHDGKLFVTSMLPLLLVGLTLGVRDRRLQGYAIAALAVGLIMLSPHPQMAEFALLAAGIFTLYLVFSTDEVTTTPRRLTGLALALAAVVLGVGVSAAQYLPFYEYIKYSPRDATVLNDFAWSAAYAIPWAHVPELVIPRFTGETFSGSYWGPNGLKLHSEYLGLTVVALSVVGGMDPRRRRMVVWLYAIGMLFLLIALGSGTPFFELWWRFVPFAKSTRAPGMALYIVAFVVAVYAAFGADRILSGGVRRFAMWAIGIGAVVALLAAAGAFGAITESLGHRIELARGYPSQTSAGAVAGETLRWSALVAGAALAFTGLAAWLVDRRSVTARTAAITIVVLLGIDLWSNARPFWIYSDSPEELFGSDEIKARLRAVPPPFRVWNLELPDRGVRAVYPGAALMADDIPQLYGHHGNEPHSFDLLNGRIGSSLTFRRAGDPHILDLFAVNYLVMESRAARDSLAGFRRLIADARASSGATAALYERLTPIPYARLVPLAVQANLRQSVGAIREQAFDANRFVLIDSTMRTSSDTTPAALPNPLPAPIANPITVEDYVPGRMRLRLAQPAATPAYALVSENWDSPWRAWVDGRETRVLRGDATLITVPVPAGARVIELRYESAAYARGKVISLVSLGLVILALVIPVVRKRARQVSLA